MNRVGREPAEDVKRRLVHACCLSGLKVATARMYLRHDMSGRLIMVAASPPDWADDHPMVSLFTLVKLDGEWSGEVDIRCSTAQAENRINIWDTLVMQGRNSVPFEDLVRQLTLTLEEREQVVAAVKLGVQGPYKFDLVHWETPACMP